MSFDGPMHDLQREENSNLDHARRFGPPALIAIVALLFVFQNTGKITFEFLWFDFSWPMWIILVIFMVVGAIISWGIGRKLRKRKHDD